MRKAMGLLVLVSMVVVMAGCSGEDPDIRRGNLFYKNKQWKEAAEAYQRAVDRDPKNLDSIRQNLKNALYYYGGQLEMGDSLDGAVKYYEQGFALDPAELGICHKLANYFLEQKNYAKAANYFSRLVELDGEAPDTDQKWLVMGEDYYALGNCLYQTGKYPEAIEAFKNSVKVSPKGRFAATSKTAIEASQQKLKKK